MTIDTSNMCSHLQKKLFEEDGIYHPLWMADRICSMLPVNYAIERITQMEHHFEKALAVIKDSTKTSKMLEELKENVAILDEYYGSELWKQDLADDEAGRFPKDLKRGVLSEDGIWNLLSDYRDLNSNKN